jgi:putative phage-type endonuclease
MNDRYYIGGGLIAMILGISPFGTPLDAYQSIIGERPALSREDQEFFERRKLWEPYALECFVRATGRHIRKMNQRYDDASFPWAKAEIDGETDFANVEVKTVDRDVEWMWGDPATEEAPMYVTAQAAWGIGVHPKELAYIHAFSISRDRIYEWPRDDEVVLSVRDAAHRFWHNHVEKRRPPLPTNVADVLTLYGRGTARALEASDEVISALEARQKAKWKIIQHEKEVLDAELTIKKFMCDASVLTVRGKTVATWRSDSRGIRKFITK